MPLIAGDQIDPFIVNEGNECKLMSAPTSLPFAASVSPTASPSASPSASLTARPLAYSTNLPSDSPTVTPPCIVANKMEYERGEDTHISFDFTYDNTTEGMKGPLQDDWIGIYPCGNTMFKHSEAWLWACVKFGENFMSWAGPASSGTVTFQDPMPAYINPGGPHTYPIAPFHKDSPDSEINTCFQAVLLQFDEPSVPPYVTSCLPAEFTINAGTAAGCQVRPSSPAFDIDPKQRHRWDTATCRI